MKRAMKAGGEHYIAEDWKQQHKGCCLDGTVQILTFYSLRCVYCVMCYVILKKTKDI